MNNPFMYTGRFNHPELELSYFRARWFDPALGRFISRDPLEFVDGMSLYRAYFVPDGVDPFGLEGAYSRKVTKYYSRYKDQKWNKAKGAEVDKDNPLAPAYELFFHTVTLTVKVNCDCKKPFTSSVIGYASVRSERSNIFSSSLTALISESGILGPLGEYYPAVKVAEGEEGLGGDVFEAEGKIFEISCKFYLENIAFAYTTEKMKEAKEDGTLKIEDVYHHYLVEADIFNYQPRATTPDVGIDFDMRLMDPERAGREGKHLIELTGPNDPKRPKHRK
jgi:RHS repeat-associated protein